jgi:hypothetical protein
VCACTQHRCCYILLGTSFRSRRRMYSARPAAMLDLTPFSDALEYVQLAPELPRALYDDRVRTWTVSSAHPTLTRSFQVTIRHKGLMSGALFLIAQHEHQNYIAIPGMTTNTTRCVRDFWASRERSCPHPHRPVGVCGLSAGWE